MEGDNSAGLGVNLIAYIRAEMGLGAAARGIAHALESAGVPFNVLNFAPEKNRYFFNASPEREGAIQVEQVVFRPRLVAVFMSTHR